MVTGQEIRSIPNGSVLHPDAPMTLRVGTTVIGIDPLGKTVLARRAAGSRARAADETAAVERIGYDVLVLATGARAVVPPLSGFLAGHPAETGNGAGGREARLRSDDRLSADVAVLHSLADARRIAAFAQAARRTGGRVAVLGGGVLGLEAARALAARGTTVTVVHRGGHLMDRQLDAAAGRVLAAAMRRTGVGVSLGTGAARWESGRGLWLSDGHLVQASGLVLSTGTVPCTELAGDAGLRLTESGAVAVDDTLATSAPGIYAIGDCAGPSEGRPAGWSSRAGSRRPRSPAGYRRFTQGTVPGQRSGDQAEGRRDRTDRRGRRADRARP